MDYLQTVLGRLSATDLCTYHPGLPAATEPTALAAIALFAHGRDAAAKRLVDRLLEMQNRDGSVGVDRLEQTPGWATPWAVLAWRAAQASSMFQLEYVAGIDVALQWILTNEGALVEQTTDTAHDTTMRGWPWVIGTHSWLEPTAISVLALRHAKRGSHVRTREATSLLVNRLLDSGGCNYGNTVVFGQELRPHLQPTGLCLLALAGEEDTTGRIGKAVEYLQRALSASTPTASLCYGLLGLAAQEALPSASDEWLQAAAGRTLARDASSYPLALLALAALGNACPLIPEKAPARTEVLLPS
jgi:hypothetical protein